MPAIIIMMLLRMGPWSDVPEDSMEDSMWVPEPDNRKDYSFLYTILTLVIVIVVSYLTGYLLK